MQTQYPNEPRQYVVASYRYLRLSMVILVAVLVGTTGNWGGELIFGKIGKYLNIVFTKLLFMKKKNLIKDYINIRCLPHLLIRL